MNHREMDAQAPTKQQQVKNIEYITKLLVKTILRGTKPQVFTRQSWSFQKIQACGFRRYRSLPQHKFFQQQKWFQQGTIHAGSRHQEEQHHFLQQSEHTIKKKKKKRFNYSVWGGQLDLYICQKQFVHSNLITCNMQ